MIPLALYLQVAFSVLIPKVRASDGEDRPRFRLQAFPDNPSSSDAGVGSDSSQMVAGPVHAT